jgi:hypothetical protein
MDFELHRRLEEESSLLNWYQLIANELPVPYTTILRLNENDLKEMRGFLDGKPLSVDLALRIKDAADVTGYPMFLRTDQASDKHSFKDAAYVENNSELMGHIARTAEFNMMADIIGLSWEALIFRRYIPLVYSFKAFNFLPIARERRYFVKDGKVICHHPYWTQDAIHGRGDCKLPDDWKYQLRRLNIEDDAEQKALDTYAKLFSRLVPGYWSVDFALAQSGQWILIDAARGEVSWHPNDCPHCPEESKTPKTEQPDFESMLIQKNNEAKV